MIRKELIILWISIISCSHAAHILLLPNPIPSRTMEMKYIGEALVKAGHTVIMVLPPKSPWTYIIKEENNINVLTYKSVDPDLFEINEDPVKEAEFNEFLMNTPQIELFRGMSDPKRGGVQWCTNSLGDKELFRNLKNQGFDIAIVDSGPMAKCLYIIPYRLDIPYMSLSGFPEFWSSRTPALPSFVPFIFGNAYTTEMSLYERLDNLWTQVFFYMWPQIRQIDDSLVAKYAPEKPAVSFNYLSGKSIISFIDTDTAIDYPRPMMPNEIFVGGLSTGPAKKLPDAFENIMSHAADGVIVISFGSFPLSFSKEKIELILSTVQKLPQTVIWRYPRDIHVKVPRNVHIVPWMPLADILGHKNTKLFITHSGANSQFEALYHAVPMLGIPLFVDQHYNAKRMVWKGLGEELDFKTLTSDDLYEIVNLILHDPKYKENMDKASAIYRDQLMTPTDRVVYWTEYVLKHGGDHLHSYALDMPWYQYLMLDILFISFILPFILIWLCVNVFHKCCKLS